MLLRKHSARGIPGLFRRLAHALAMAACLAVAGTAQAAAESGPDFVGTHLERGQAYLDKGEYAQAILEFEQVLQFDNLPPGLKEQAEIYAEAARNRNAGNPLSSFGYAEVGGGYYHENTTRTTEPGAAQRSAFGKVRVGGGLGYLLGDGLSLDGTLDYRYRKYDDSARRDDKDLRWSGLVNQTLENGSRAVGLRGRASYRGSDGYRQDFGIFANQSFNTNPLERITVQGELRRRLYPAGELRSRSRDIGELWLRWTRSLYDGRGELTLSANAGHEWATHDRLDGDNTFYGLTADWSMQVSDTLDVFLFGMWEHNGYHDDREQIHDEEIPPTLYTRNDDSYELEAGLTWHFAPQWSLRPTVLYIRDSSNTFWGAYSSTETWVMLRRAF
jgi:tetratricopeptide (TPR) repeat protein